MTAVHRWAASFSMALTELSGVSWQAGVWSAGAVSLTAVVALAVDAGAGWGRVRKVFIQIALSPVVVHTSVDCSLGHPRIQSFTVRGRHS